MDDPTPPEPTGQPRPPSPPRTVAAAEPISHTELAACLTRPHRMLDIVLGERHRLSANIRTGTELRTLVATLLVCATVFSVPFAIVDGFGRLAHVAVLFLGSVLLCFPSLLVFGSYLGVRLHAAQSLTIALVIPAAAAAFTLGFAPIYWFLDATMPDDGSIGGPATRIVLLVASLLLALSHLNRCLFADGNLRALRDNWPLWVGWQLLLVFLTYRMANTLGLLA